MSCTFQLGNAVLEVATPARQPQNQQGTTFLLSSSPSLERCRVACLRAYCQYRVTYLKLKRQASYLMSFAEVNGRVPEFPARNICVPTLSWNEFLTSASAIAVGTVVEL